MVIHIDHREALIKEGSSFEYISSNRLFGSADGYSMSIEFPLDGCPQNREIFGYINRKDVALGRVYFDCDITDRHIRLTGTLTITEISDSEVKGQFLEGRSEQNFNKSLDDIYINELSLCIPPESICSDMDVQRALHGVDDGGPIPITGIDPLKTKYVALPWIAGKGRAIQNPMTFWDAGTVAGWAQPSKKISCQPYLLWIIQRICDEVGYTCNISALFNDPGISCLLICNSLPGEWDDRELAHALPHWSVAEFFEKLELFLNGEFEIDYRAKHILFRFSSQVAQNTPEEMIESVVDEYTQEISSDGDTEYIYAKTLKYKEPSYNTWKFLSCQWFIDGTNDVQRYSYPSIESLLAATKDYSRRLYDRGRWPGWPSHLFHTADSDTFYMLYPYDCISTGYTENDKLHTKYNIWSKLLPVNIFAPLNYIPGNAESDSIELEFVPVGIEYSQLEYGWCMWLDTSDNDVPDSSDEVDASLPDSYYRETNSMEEMLMYTSTKAAIEAGSEKETAEYFDVIYLGWWNGTRPVFDGSQPHPAVSELEIGTDWQQCWPGTIMPHTLPFSLHNRYHAPTAPKIDIHQKCKFDFLSDYIPSPRAIFNIRGKRYLCEKITVTFSENGMSQLLKGEFYPITAD